MTFIIRVAILSDMKTTEAQVTLASHVAHARGLGWAPGSEDVSWTQEDGALVRVYSTATGGAAISVTVKRLNVRLTASIGRGDSIGRVFSTQTETSIALATK